MNINTGKSKFIILYKFSLYVFSQTMKCIKNTITVTLPDLKFVGLISRGGSSSSDTLN